MLKLITPLFANARLATQELWTNKTRLLLTIIAIAWGTFTISTLLALGQGLRVNLIKRIRISGGSLFYVYGGQTSSNYGGRGQVNIQLTPQDLQAIQAGLPNIQRAIGVYNFWRPDDDIKVGTHRPGGHVITGVPPAYARLHYLQLTPGSRFINRLDQLQLRRVVVLGDTVAANLFPHLKNPIGKSVSIFNLPFTVIGIVSPKQPKTGIGEVQMAMQVLLPDVTLRAITNQSFYGNLIIQIDPHYNSSRMLNNIQKIIATNHHVDPQDPGIVYSFDGHKLMRKMFDVLLGLQVFLGLVGGLTLIVAGVGVANVVYASVARAIPSIGMRMAIGATSRDIIAHYLYQALAVTAWGGSIGILASLAVCGIIRAMHIQGAGGTGPIIPMFSWSVCIILLSVLGSIGFLSGYFPARKASQVDPVVALRHD